MGKGAHPRHPHQGRKEASDNFLSAALTLIPVLQGDDGDGVIDRSAGAKEWRADQHSVGLSLVQQRQKHILHIPGVALGVLEAGALGRIHNYEKARSILRRSVLLGQARKELPSPGNDGEEKARDPEGSPNQPSMGMAVGPRKEAKGLVHEGCRTRSFPGRA